MNGLALAIVLAITFGALYSLALWFIEIIEKSEQPTPPQDNAAYPPPRDEHDPYWSPWN